MSLYHVIAGNHEFIGDWDKNVKDVVLLKNTVKLMYIKSQQGIQVQMNNLNNDNNYKGKVIITDGPGVIKMPLQVLGQLAKTYQRTQSKIDMVSSKIIQPAPNLNRVH